MIIEKLYPVGRKWRYKGNWESMIAIFKFLILKYTNVSYGYLPITSAMDRYWPVAVPKDVMLERFACKTT